MFRLVLLSVVALLTAGTHALAQGYEVRAGDRLEISVLEDPSLNRTVLVRPDGRITMPLAGTVQAEGNTPEQIQATIRRNLSRDFVAPPTVTVAVASLGAPDAVSADETGLASIYVLGEVARPGVYQIDLPFNALQALALAGGPGAFAARKRVQVRRRDGDAGETVFLLDYDGVERGAVPSALIPLADGDVIVVPERRLFE